MIADLQVFGPRPGVPLDPVGKRGNGLPYGRMNRSIRSATASLLVAALAVQPAVSAAGEAARSAERSPTLRLLRELATLRDGLAIDGTDRPPASGLDRSMPPASLRVPEVPAPETAPEAALAALFKDWITPEAVAAYVAHAADPHFEGRGIGTAAGAEYGRFLEERLRAAGLTVETQPFVVRPGSDFMFGGRRVDSILSSARGRNVIGRLAGADPVIGKETVILSAHFDHLVPTRDWGHWLLPPLVPLALLGPAAVGLSGPLVTALAWLAPNLLLRDFMLDVMTGRLVPMPGKKKIFPGADDNGSGTGALLAVSDALGELARSGRRPRRTIAVAFFDGEEVGLRGAHRYIQGLSEEEKDRIVQVVNLDMVGWSDPGHPDRIKVIVPPALPMLLQAVLGPVMPRRSGREFAENHNPLLVQAIERINARLTLGLDLDYTNHEFNGSDHFAFHRMRRPDGRTTSTVMFYDGGNGPYHRESDRSARIDGAFAARVARLAAHLAWEIADAERAPRFE